MRTSPAPIDFLAPPLCLLCRARVARSLGGPSLCRSCAGELYRSQPLRLRGDGLDGGLAAFPYAGAGRRLVAALKFARLGAAAELGAALLVERAGDDLAGGTLVPVPAAPLRTLRRGIDPALEIARAIAAIADLPLEVPLRRRDLGRQRGRDRRRRLARPPAVRSVARAPETVLLVDDVVTTGATLTACAAELRAAGAERVSAFALAAVRPPGSAAPSSAARRRGSLPKPARRA